MGRTTTGGWQKLGDIAARAVTQARRLIADTRGASAKIGADQECRVSPLGIPELLGRKARPSSPNAAYPSSEAAGNPLPASNERETAAQGPGCGGLPASPCPAGNRAGTIANGEV